MDRFYQFGLDRLLPLDSTNDPPRDPSGPPSTLEAFGAFSDFHQGHQ